MVSDFTAYYFSYWRDFLPSVKLQSLSSFDGQIMTFPNLESIQDYLRWKQADHHINNLYNTCFRALVHSGVTLEEARKKLCVSIIIMYVCMRALHYVACYSNIKVVHGRALFIGGEVIILLVTTPDQRPPSLLTLVPIAYFSNPQPNVYTLMPINTKSNHYINTKSNHCTIALQPATPTEQPDQKPASGMVKLKNYSDSVLC